MATIQQSLRLYDGMTGPLNSINQVLHSVVDSFEAMQSITAIIDYYKIKKGVEP